MATLARRIVTRSHFGLGHVRALCTGSVSPMATGTEFYMSLYPEGSTDGGLRLGNIVPDFSAETTQGPWESFHEWKKGKWAILFSHPADARSGSLQPMPPVPLCLVSAAPHRYPSGVSAPAPLEDIV